MENTGISKPTAAYGYSLAIVSVINAVLVVLKEKNKSVMDGMTRLTGHHWLTHSAISILLFVVLGAVFARTLGGSGKETSAKRLINVLLSGIVLGGLIIVGFYLFED